jgi:hypothetical protein
MSNSGQMKIFKNRRIDFLEMGEDMDYKMPAPKEVKTPVKKEKRNKTESSKQRATAKTKKH